MPVIVKKRCRRQKSEERNVENDKDKLDIVGQFFSYNKELYVNIIEQ